MANLTNCFFTRIVKSLAQVVVLVILHGEDICSLTGHILVHMYISLSYELLSMQLFMYIERQCTLRTKNCKVTQCTLRPPRTAASWRSR